MSSLAGASVAEITSKLEETSASLAAGGTCEEMKQLYEEHQALEQALPAAKADTENTGPVSKLSDTNTQNP